MSMKTGGGAKYATCLEGGHHLALFLTVEQTVVVLHRDKRREVVCDGVVCENQLSYGNLCERKGDYSA
jgi:hypothetical protein